MKKIIFFFSILSAGRTFAQVPEDAIRYSWFTQNASARILGAGGVMGSVGGDITAGFVNPAGLGFYRIGEAVISPGFSFSNVKENYRGNAFSDKKNRFLPGPSGAIIAFNDNNNKDRSHAVGIAFTQTANFNNTIHYSGLNNYSSYSERFAEEFASLKTSIDNVLNTNSVAPYTSAPALYTYLIDTVTVNGKLIVKAAPEYILDAGQALKQEMTKTTKGGMYELNFAFAGNDGKKWLYGASVGIPIVNYESNTLFAETDTSSNTANHFERFSFNDNFTTKGAGINGRLGVIYRPKEYFRLGLALHTPSYMVLTDSRETQMTTVVENPVLSTSVSSKLFTNDQRGEARYMQSSPWRVLLSGSYVFREVSDVRRQRGFISADIEYVNHKGSRFSSQKEDVPDNEKAYYKQLNSVVKNIYKGAFNFRVGGELKFNVIMARLGFGYYGNPYKESPSQTSKMTMSGGLGYRNKGFFVDLAYVYAVTKDFDIPYRLESAQNVYASLKENRGNAMVTVGIKF